MRDQRPNKLPAIGNEAALLLCVLGVLVAALGLWALLYSAAALAGLGEGGPVRWVFAPADTGRWSGEASRWLALLCVPLALVAWAVGRLVRSGRSGRRWTDHLAAAMSSRRDLDDLTPEKVAADTERLGSEGAGVGVWLCKAVLTGQWLVATYEYCQVWIMGPRAGKTRSVAVPSLVEHGGPAVATSNKRDIVYLTRGPRSERGRTWIFDPQSIYRAAERFWWNPLSYVTSLERAEKMATIWLDSRSGSDMGAEDAYFGPEGRNLLANMILAAAVGQQPVSIVLTWLQFPDGAPGLEDPVALLRSHGYAAVADDIASTRQLVAETRDGVYSGARSGVRWMRNPAFMEWISPPSAGDDRPEFRTERLVRSTDTLYLLSKDSEGSARALVGSLTAAVWEAGRELAEEHGDRVPTPVLFVLDECANIVRWRELPNLFSYSGSLGLILMVFLQSRAQGQRCWGREGFAEMWSAANVGFAGRGLNDDEHLGALSQLIGDRQRIDRSRSTGRGQSASTSTSIKEERILTESDLRSLPTGRGVLFVSGTRPILGELVDLSKRRDAERIAASVDAFKEPWMEIEDAKVDASRETDAA